MCVLNWDCVFFDIDGTFLCNFEAKLGTLFLPLCVLNWDAVSYLFSSCLGAGSLTGFSVLLFTKLLGGTKLESCSFIFSTGMDVS